MGQITLTGLSTGVDTSAIIKQLMVIESRRLATYKVSKSNFEKQTTALKDLRSKIAAVKSAASELANVRKMQLFSASSSNKDIVSVNASSEANPGSHTIQINQMAAADAWIQETSVFNYKTDYVGGGSFIYTYNGRQRIITAVAGETTLEDLVNLINNDENNPGVTASLLYQSGKYHLMLTGHEMGHDFQISIDSSTREVWKPDSNQPHSTFTSSQLNASLSTKIINLDQFGGTLGTADKIIISGKNHAGSNLPDTEISVTENTTLGHLIDAINRHFDGTATARLENGQIWLTDNTCGSSGLEISLSYSGDAVLHLPSMTVSAEGGRDSESLALLGSASFIQTQNASDAQIKIDGFPFSTANEVQTLSITGGIPAAGTFRLTLNGQTTDPIAYNASAADVQAALLNLSGVEEGDIVCTGSALPAGPIAIAFGGRLAGMDVSQITVSDDGSLDAGVVSIVETVKGSDGWIHRSSNHITDVLAGINLTLNDVTPADNPVKITVTRNTATLTKKIQSFVAAYNDLMDELESKTEYNAETKTMGILSRDVAAAFLKTQASTPFTAIARGFLESADAFVQADGIGITLDGNGRMELDAEKFEKALAANYQAVLELLGAAKKGASSNAAVQVYNTSEKYTAPGIYHVKIEVDESGSIVSAKIKLSTESEYRDAVSWSGGIITFDSSFDGTGNPLWPEHSLQLSVDAVAGTYGTDANPVVVRIKQGIFGNLNDMLTQLTKTNGQLDVSAEALDQRISRMTAKIEKEEARLKRVEQRLTEKYSRLEKILTAMQQQMNAVSAMYNF